MNSLPRCAALLLDLQHDFLGSSDARMPVGRDEALRVLDAANAVIDGTALAGALRVIVVNRFPKSAWFGNFFRRGAAVEGSPGARLDERLHADPRIEVFSKRSSSAFSNASLAPYLAEHSISRLFVLGVFAEGCIRATAIDAVERGFEAVVAVNAIGTDSEVKRRFALWAMGRAGVRLMAALPENAAGRETPFT